MEGNDLVDVGFLASTLPYFGAVTVDRAMGARIAEAGLEQICQARIIKKIDQLEELLRALY